MRRLIAFPCGVDTLAGTIDGAPRNIGLLIVSGGREIRVGARGTMARLAQRIAAAGHPVFRYDRRGVGDSSGADPGFRNSGPDVAAAVAAFRREAPHLTRIVALGNCDAASALALHGRAAGIDAVLLANPWVIDPGDDLPPAAAIRRRYLERVKDPAQWLRLLSGAIDLRKLYRGLARVFKSRSEAADRTIMEGIRAWGADAVVILAERDATAIAYRDAARGAKLAIDTRVIDTNSHGFVLPADADALRNIVLSALA